MEALSRSVTKNWGRTLRLPKSKFPARASPSDTQKYRERCTEGLYTWQNNERPAENTFVLHDGPPYANGDLHIGHALNKILKDIICRVQVGRGMRVRFVPGWDCHGLPIELKALDDLTTSGKVDQNGHINQLMIRRRARNLASRTMTVQESGFRLFGVSADWKNGWATMDKEYTKRQLSVFREMVDSGLIYRRFKPVYWSASSGTALAEAELEYKDHTSLAALVKFPLVTIPPHLARDPLLQVDDLGALIWTTTPWTLPANGAIAVNESLEYSIVKTETRGHLLVAQTRLEYLEHELKEDISVIIPSIMGSELAGQTTYRPLFKGPDADPQPVIAADFVTADSGSGLVHCAPGHGMEDYEACLAHGIPAFSPVDEKGRFTDEAMPHQPWWLSGTPVFQGTNHVLKYIRLQGNLISEHPYKHRYPHDWRTKGAVIIRATEQWFADVGGIRDTALKALDDVRFTPESAKQRLVNFVKGRSEWCISRQRVWGVPIPALYHRETGEAILTKDTVSHIMSVIEERGIGAWWENAADDPAWIPPTLQGPASQYRRGADTMDVWFDSGTSWTGIGPRYGDDVDRYPPADVYLEGTDQHRGWFQSSLLTYIAHQVANGITPVRAPFKHLVTHGFTLDEYGRKMSKSLGNVVGPQSIMSGTFRGKNGQKPDPLGPDALRLWVASSDYTKDVALGQQVLQTVCNSLHKYRVTFKLLLGALADFNPNHHVPYDKLHMVDRFALMRLHNMVTTCHTAYDNFEFYKAVNAINRWANLEFSAFYMESVKDRLYTLKEDDPSRRAVQTTLFQIYCYLQETLAPITPLLVTEAWEHTPEAIRRRIEDPLKRIILVPPVEWQDPSLEKDFMELIPALTAIKTAQEAGRAEKNIGSSLECFVHLALPENTSDDSVFRRHLSDLPGICVVSDVSLGTYGDLPTEISSQPWQYMAEFDLPNGRGAAYVYPPQSHKCPRCWRYVVPEEDQSLCARCDEVVKDLQTQDESL